MSGPDRVTVRDTAQSFDPCPEGQHQAVCADCIDLGEKADTFPGSDTKLVHKIALVFQVGEADPKTDKRYTIAQEFSATFGPKSNLRKFVTAWRGKPYTDEEARAGAPLDKLVGANALLSVTHKTSGAGRTYGLISAVMPLLKGMEKISAEGYERAAYWQARKDEYAKGAAAYRLSINAPANDDEADPLPSDDGDSSLPF